MGRHSAPPTGDTVVDRRPLVLAAAAAAVVLVLVVVGLVYALRGDGDDGTTTANPGSTRRTSGSGSPSSSAPTSPAASASSTSAAPSTSPSPSASPTASGTTKAPARPPTLRLQMAGRSYVRVRTGGRTIFEQTLRKGETRTFDQRSLTVLVGNASAVRATINGKLRTSGRTGQVETFVARR